MGPGEAISHIQNWPGHHPALCVLTNETMAAVLELMRCSDVRVERLQDISEADCIAEGIERHGRFYGLADADWDDGELSAVNAYRRLWNAINGVGAWDRNPWVVAVTFRPERRNIDA